jgi:glyoxylase-like metal-dependent hydrolase (beta-lactamase superfamily II)
VLHTPGHASDHLCFFLEEERVLFTGDTVLSGSTTVINPPDGDMAAYLQSLERLRKRRLSRLCPGHGDVLDDPKAILSEYVDHRMERENQILEILSAGPSKITDLVSKIYVDVPEALHDMAGRSVLAHLQKLKAEGRVSGRDVNSAWKVA